MVMKYSELYLAVRKALLRQETPETAGMMARHLLCTVSGKSQEKLLADMDLYAPETVCGETGEKLKRLLAGEPFAYVLGEWEFYGLPLYVDRNVLIPRDDTCAVTQMAIQKALFLDSDPRILDLCCGSGCIGLAIASRVKDARVTLADISKEALTVAKKNIQRNHLGGRVSSVQVDARLPVSSFLGKFDMVVSNPPYVTDEEMEQLPESVRGYEPHLALEGGEDGLNFYRCIAENFAPALKPGGFLCFEFGMGQGDAVCKILEETGYTVLKRAKDFNERERAVLAQYGRKE